ncbi:MAG: hypothetical protein ACJA2C_000526 [Marinoscillum sp.]|jgi:hypothetical protein
MSFAQTRETSRNSDMWFLNDTKYNMGEHWRFENEVHLRRTSWLADDKQILIRPSVSYAINPAIRFHVGYTHVVTYPYGDQPVILKTPENNFWVQTILYHEVERVKFSHRYRLEERWIGQAVGQQDGSYEIDGSVHKSRFRYRITCTKKIADSKSYFIFFDELFINTSKDAGLNRFDQNWVYGGIGYEFSPALKLEMGYMWQLIEKPNGIQYESNNVIHFFAFYTIASK